MHMYIIVHVYKHVQLVWNINEKKNTLLTVNRLFLEFNATESLQMVCECYKCLAINPNCLRILYEYVKNMISLRILGACS